MTSTVPTSDAAARVSTMIAVSAIAESKSNPRSHFDETKLAELTESILRFGVLQPVLVRPKDGSYELVAGHRRLRAARNAPLEEIPAIVQELSDKEVLEVQIVENMQRADLHPLEEAEGYLRLLRDHGYDADSLALKIGKSRSYVYGRIKLGELAEPVKKALHANEISHSVALLIARIPDEKLQKDALKEVTPRYEGHEPMSYRAASDYIQRTYMLRLTEAPWQLADAQLTAAGPCTTCPMRTGNQSELFSDVKSADVCTLPSCFAKKSAAWLQREADTKGYSVLTPSQVKKQFSQYGGGLEYSSDYVDLETACWQDPKNRTYGKLLLADAPIVLALHNNKVHKLIAKKDLNREMKRAGHETKAPKDSRGSSPSRTSSASTNAQNEKWERERELKHLTERGLIDAIAKSKISADTETLRFLTKAQLLLASPTGEDLEIYGYTGADGDDEILAWADKLTMKQLLAVLAGESLIRTFYGSNADEKALRVAFFKHIAVNPDKVAEQVKAKAKADAAAAKKAAKKPAAKKATAKAA
jgi:ParB/RepB/Spo0J family partition protein